MTAAEVPLPPGGNLAAAPGVYPPMIDASAASAPPAAARPLQVRPPGAGGPVPPPGRAAAEAAPPRAVRTGEFSDFYRASWDGVARGLALTLGDADLAAEAADEAMARAYPRWATLRTYDNPAGWVYRVGLNWARSHHRRARRLLPLSRHDPPDLGPVADPAVRDALLGLDLRLRSVVVCRLLLDWSVEETAEALRVRPGTVKSRLHRALRTLEPALAHLR